MRVTEHNRWRQLDIFRPENMRRSVHIVGCGAIGSNLAETLFKAGIGEIHAYDMDEVEDHNLPNQAFRRCHLGLKKTAAMVELGKEHGAIVIPHEGKVEALDFNEPCYLFMAVDSMAARKSIFDGVKFNPNVRWIEARMAAEYGFVFAISPMNLKEIGHWEKNWFPDDKAPESACTNRAVGTTARFMASYMAHALISWEAADDPKKERDRPPHETMLSFIPFMMKTTVL